MAKQNTKLTKTILEEGIFQLQPQTSLKPNYGKTQWEKAITGKKSIQALVLRKPIKRLPADVSRDMMLNLWQGRTPEPIKVKV